MTANAWIGLATVALATLGAYVVLRAIVRGVRRAGRAIARGAQGTLGAIEATLDRGAPIPAAADDRGDLDALNAFIGASDASDAPMPRPSHPGQCGAWPVVRPFDLQHAKRHTRAARRRVSR